MNPTILIGIDGATFSILDPLMADGHLPHLRRLVHEGVRAELLSTPHPLTPPAWTTLMTGRTPGNHGIFDFIWAEERGSQVFFTLNSFHDIRVETIWTLVSRLGGTVTALNFPLTAPPPSVAGAIVPGLVSWKHLRRNVHPPELYAALKGLPGFDPKGIAWDFDREKRATKVVPPEEREEWIRFHIQRERHWFEIFRHLYRNHRTDLVAVLLDGVDKIQHICWTSLDPENQPKSPGERDILHRELCLDYFRQLDAFIGEVIATAPPEARIFLASDHGFGPSTKVFRVNKWLEQKGYLTWGRTSSLDTSEREKVDKMVNNHFVYLDWSKTTAYAQSAATNGIHIRVARKPGDSGVPPEQYLAFRDRLAKELLEVRDPADGTRMVTRVLTRDEFFPGDCNERCADLTLVLSDYGFVSTLDVEPVIWHRPEVAGVHRPAGIFMARGPGIRKGETLSPQAIVDIAPTLLHSLGLPVPEDFEGRVIRDAFENAFLAGNEVRFGSAATSRTPGGGTQVSEAAEPADTDEENEALILDRLRALGYVE
jgi:predicted AlkP superfamily phosphohydrolase/phosphomutase